MSISTESDRDTIERCAHDAENPYAQILNSVIRHKQLSFEAIWLLTYLLANDRKFKIWIPKIIEHVKGRMGRAKVYALLKELIEMGYMERVPILKGNLHSGYKYYVSETAKFKKSLDVSISGMPELGLPETDTYKNNQSLKKTKVKEQQQKTKVADAPVVVSSSSQKKKEQTPDKEAQKTAEIAASRYIEALIKSGEVVDKAREIRIRRSALNKCWKPNAATSKIDLISKFKNGALYQGKGGEYECIKDEVGIGFLPVDYYAPQPYSANFNSPMFRQDLEKILEKLEIDKLEEN